MFSAPHPTCKPVVGDSQGFSLVELLVAVAVVGLLLSAVYGVFINFLTQSGQQAALNKRAADMRAGLSLMRRDLFATGIGIAQEELDAAVAGANASVTIRSTVMSGRGHPAGEYGVFRNGDVAGIGGETLGLPLTGSREKAVSSKGKLTNLDAADGRIFFAGNQNSGEEYYFEREFRLSDSTGRQCASGTQNLLWEGYPDAAYGGSSPLVDCVLNFRVVYGFHQSGGGVDYADSASAAPDDSSDLRPDLLKVGLMVQAGDRFRGKNVSPASMNYTDPDLNGVGTVDLSADQRKYEWTRVEWSIPLTNIPQ